MILQDFSSSEKKEEEEKEEAVEEEEVLELDIVIYLSVLLFKREA